MPTDSCPGARMSYSKKERERVCTELLLGTWMRTSFLWKGSVHTLVFSMHGPTLHFHN